MADSSSIQVGEFRVSYEPQTGGLVLVAVGQDQHFRSDLLGTEDVSVLWGLISSQEFQPTLQDEGRTLVLAGASEYRLHRTSCKVERLEQQLHQLQEQVVQLQEQVEHLKQQNHDLTERSLLLAKVQSEAIITGTHNEFILRSRTDYHHSYHTSTPSSDWLSLEFRQEVFVQALHLRFFDGDKQHYTFNCEISVDGTDWIQICRGVQHHGFSVIPVVHRLRFIRMNASTTTGAGLHLAMFKLL